VNKDKTTISKKEERNFKKEFNIENDTTAPTRAL